MNEQTAQLKKYLDESHGAIAITGAGISFSAGGLNFDHTDPEGMRDLMILGSFRSIRAKRYLTGRQT